MDSEHKCYCASSLGIIAIYRYGVQGTHGRSYLFLTFVGLSFRFSADAAELYYYVVEGHEEQKLVSISDWLWFAGYGFLSAHLFTVISSIHSYIRAELSHGISYFGLIFCLQYPSTSNTFFFFFFAAQGSVHAGLREGPLTAACDQVTVSLQREQRHLLAPTSPRTCAYALAKVVTDVPAALSPALRPPGRCGAGVGHG